MADVALILLIALMAGLLGAFVMRHRADDRLLELRIRNAQLVKSLQASTEARQEAEVLQALSAVSYNALILLDSERRVVHMNDAARELFRRYTRSREPLEGTLISITRAHELDDLVKETLATGEGVEVQLSVENSTFRVRTRTAEMDGQPFVAVAMQDVSELQRLGRARRDMVANVSHELRTPITSIRLLVDTLKRDQLCGPGRGLELLQKITDEADTLQQIAQELLDLSMIESGRAEFIMKPVAVQDIVDEIVERFSEQMRRSALTVEIDVPPEVAVLADAQQVERVLANLLHNAIKFTPEGGAIQLEARPSGDWVTLSVTDTGPGIPPDERDRVFERFYRSDRARGGSGTGLGLAIAKHIVQSHGGRIWAEPAPHPPGARISFTLPTPDE